MYDVLAVCLDVSKHTHRLGKQQQIVVVSQQQSITSVALALESLVASLVFECFGDGAMCSESICLAVGQRGSLCALAARCLLDR